MYNTSQRKCISYKFISNKLQVAYCEPTTIEIDGENVPVGSGNQPNDTDICNASSWAGCLGGYSYSDMGQSTIVGKFDVTPTNRTPGSEEIGRATISMTVGNGTDLQQTIQSSVSFRDYDEIIQ
jgi:hypothetical protein